MTSNIFGFNSESRHDALFFTTPRYYYFIDKKTIPYYKLPIFWITCIVTTSISYESIDRLIIDGVGGIVDKSWDIKYHKTRFVILR